MSSYVRSGALISAYQCLLALASTHEYGAIAQLVLMSGNECPWPHGPMVMTPPELPRVFIAPLRKCHEYSCLLMSNYEHSWLYLVASVCS